MKKFTSNSQKIGKLGEDIACKYLIGKGFSLVERNYTKKWGEIDIIAEKNGKIYFVEVKAVSRSISNKEEGENVSGETNNKYRPEENMHPWKVKRLRRVVETYLIGKRVGGKDWQFDIALVYLDVIQRKARVRILENVIL